ncbi:uncharacterized protein [Penaeus vannamei]|uniref:uncharacterized protein n=1 Tax=Penaeus vannamei TaxID=6689 RepID=UPI000F680599|nr:uncharacterized protein LOC113811126 [Penaeus vannamei]
MAAKGLLVFAVLVAALALCHASETPTKKTDGRLFSSNDDTSVSIDSAGVIGLVVLAIIIGLIGMALGVFSNGKADLTGFGAPTGYAASAPAYAPAPTYAHEESAYNVHRSMEDAHTKYQ